jgi:hypothetical protein
MFSKRKFVIIEKFREVGRMGDANLSECEGEMDWPFGEFGAKWCL